MVFYTWGEEVMANKFDPGFGQIIKWDIDLLDGYRFRWVKNTSGQPGSHHFQGIDNPSLVDELQRWTPDAILVFGWNFKSHLQVMRHFHKKSSIFFRGDSTLLDGQNSLKRLLKRIVLKWVYSFVDKAFYVGEANRDYFKFAGLKNEQLVFAPHAIDNARFTFNGEARNRVRRSQNIPDSAIVFLFAGKLEPKKDPGLLLAAFSQLGLDTYLIIAGSGILETSLKATFDSHPNIRFLPFQNQSDMPGLYSACDIFVLPSKGPGETWGLAVNEAMACGRAVIVSDKCGCAADLVKHNENGFVFPAENGKQLSQALKACLVNPERLSEMGMESSKIIQQFSYQSICESLEITTDNLF